MIHLVNQLLFSRSEFQKSFMGVSDLDGSKHFGAMNNIAWIVGHLAWHEQSYWIKKAQGVVLYPILETDASSTTTY